MLRNFIYSIRTLVYLLKTKREYQALIRLKGQQKQTFNTLINDFQGVLQDLSRGKENAFVLDAWQEKNEVIKQVFTPHPPFFFLRNSNILNTMFVASEGKWLKEQVRFLESEISKKKLKTLLIEDYVGGPLLISGNYITSHNTVHHLYHLQMFSKKTGYKFTGKETVVEWGGGYGNLAKLVYRLIKSNDLTYIIIDSALFCATQWLYLSTVMGSNRVNVIKNKSVKIKKGSVNLLPLGLLKHYQLKADLFISTWALSESSGYSQSYVTKRSFFDAKALLFGFQKSNDSFPYAQKLEKMIVERGGEVMEIEFLPNNYYGFWVEHKKT